MPESTKSPAEVLEADRSPVEQGLIYLIGRDIDRSIANLGYPVGMGIGVGPELAERAASRILDKLTDKALRDLLEVRQVSIRGGEA
ncbi:hypothetical protein D1604_12540 [Brevundimonas sp. LPMIX5]|uniref:hypothetical protein n=1 Tax=Brevundimonas sp. LPMIX5 TaxID=2305887 RepID=UPI000E65FC9C|nr:hypothetical protein [Brevundimonas sp. LPMIX5]RIJ65141.1 hypothetical protein D1604_12540 [Brevundimonas sp. LPMIX5]